MKKLIRTNLTIATSGAIIGVFIGFWMTILSNALADNTRTLLPSSPAWTAQFPNVLTAFIVASVLWMIMGVMFALTSYWIFAQNTRNWGITFATFLHYIITAVCSTIIAFAAGWYHTVNLDNALSFILIFSIVYLIIWAINMLRARRIVRELNTHVKE